jgi:ABC-type multidrug transport system ATPase subunit/ABC-type multidrug transport system permease subunit
MPIGVRTEGLRKVYTSPPPIAAGRSAAFAITGSQKRDSRQKFEIVALDGLSLDIRAGEIFGLLGPNGAGKSTTVGVVTTRVRPTAGEAWVGGHNVWKDRVAVKRVIGVVPQRPNLDFGLTAREILAFHGAYFGMNVHDRTRTAQQLLDRFQLADRADQLIFGFSGGMLQRLSIARAMVHDPQVLFLDEPSAGLDPQTRLLLWEIVREYNARGRTILLTTHNMEGGRRSVLARAIVDHGRVIALGTSGELKRSVPGGYVIHLQFDRFRPRARGRPSAPSPASPRSALRRGEDRSLRRPRRTARSSGARLAAARGARRPGRARLGPEPRESLSASHGPEPEELSGMNWRTFMAMLRRDAHVARRNFIPLLLQTLLQPMLFVLIFGRVMTGSGFMPPQYKSLLLPGIIAMSMMLSGIQAVAMPLIAEFQFSREIEDRLLAPMEIEWLAVEKVVAGTIQALAAGLVVIPLAWLIMGSGVDLDLHHPLRFALMALLVSCLASSIGLTLGCSVGQTQIGLMFSLVLAPMIMFGCTYYPWSALATFPILQKAVLVNPLVYASEGFRASLVTQYPHLPLPAVLAALVGFDALFLALGMRQFRRKAIG